MITEIIKVAGQSSSRSRVVMMITVIIAILTFASFWNSRQASWLNERIHILEDAKRMQAWNDSLETFYWGKINERDRYVQVRKYCIKRVIDSREDLTDLISIYRRAYLENTLIVRVSFFGASFDVNDIGTIGGIAFTIVLLVLYFALVRENDNIAIVRFMIESLENNEANNKLKLIYYNYIAMEQVLTIPKPTNQYKKHPIFIKIFPKIFFVLPLIVHLIVWSHDFVTFDLGTQVNQSIAMGSMLGSGISAIVIVFLTGFCIKEAVKTDKLFNHMYESLELPKK